MYCGSFNSGYEHGVGEYLFEKDLRDIMEIDLLKSKYNEIVT